MTERVVRGQGTDLLQKIVDVEIHFQDRFLAALVVQSDNERSRRGGCDVKVNVRPSESDVSILHARTSQPVRTGYQAHYSPQ